MKVLKIGSLSLLIISQLLVFQRNTFAQKKPNIIFILIDDQRYDYLSFLDHPYIKTPEIDKMARNAVYFDQAFVTTSLCSPSRASIITGQYAHTHNVIDNDTDLLANTPTYPKELQKEGYKTAFIGKWHMGHGSDERRPGFDYWVSFEGQGRYLNPPLNIDGERKIVEGHMTDVLTDLTVEFLKAQKGKDEPYLLVLSHKAVHENFQPTHRHTGIYKNLKIQYPESFADTDKNHKGKPEWLRKQRNSWHGSGRNFSIENYDGRLDRFVQLYGECMLGVDESVGRVVQTLKDLDQFDDTVIIYYSDNGYMLGEQGLIDKRVMYEASIRVPAFIHWPEKIRKGFISSEFVLNIDIAPTILDIAGVKKPETMHGVSFLPLALGENVEWRQDFLYEYFIDHAAVQTPTIFGLRTKEYSYMTYHGVWDNYELYDMKNDPMQMNNLLGEVNYGQGYGPFVVHAKRQLPKLAPTIEKLDNRLTELMKQTGGQRRPAWFSHPQSDCK